MKRDQFIEAVKVKIEEISPYDEPESFVAAEGDSDYESVKPILSYIKQTLDEATKNCLSSLPLTLLHADVERTNPTVIINSKGVGEFSLVPDLLNRRFIRFRHSSALERDITAFITSENPQYLVMQNPHCRPGQCKTMAVVSSDMGQMEIYSYPESMYGTTKNDAYLISINLNKVVGEASDFTPTLTAAQAQAQLVQSPIEDLIVLECAAMVSDILGNTKAADMCRNEQKMKIQATLQ